VVTLSPVVQSYAWGSRTALPELCGTTSPAPHPVAEHWFGAHDSGSSLCGDGRGLDARIAADPQGELGERVLAAHGEGLPFLVKLLSAEQALSLQAHPSPEKAREGFAAENARGIAVDAPDRNYRDSNHKPEILVALTEFHALVGFRPVDRTIALLDAIDADSLRPYRDMLAGQPDAAGLRAVFTTFVTMPHGALAEVVADLVTRAVGYLTANGVEARWSDVATTVVELAERYPTDPGVLAVLLLNRVVLQPGEAVYLGPGQLHGEAVERAGEAPLHVGGAVDDLAHGAHRRRLLGTDLLELGGRAGAGRAGRHGCRGELDDVALASVRVALTGDGAGDGAGRSSRCRRGGRGGEPEHPEQHEEHGGDRGGDRGGGRGGGGATAREHRVSEGTARERAREGTGGGSDRGSVARRRDLGPGVWPIRPVPVRRSVEFAAL